MDPPTPKEVALISIGLLVSGFMATISAKGANRRGFDSHPFTQTMFMFMGEVLLLGVVGRKATTSFVAVSDDRPPLVAFAGLAMLDLIASSFVYAGISKIDASVFMMLRSSLIPITGVIAAVVKRRAPPRCQVIGTIIVSGALVLVGFASREGAESEHNSESGAVLGAVLIVVAQILIGIMVVGEETLYGKHVNLTPLLLVGFEGLFGLIMCPCLLILTSSFPVDSDTKIDSFPNAVDEMTDDWRIVALLLTNMIAVSGLNFFGNSVTRSLTAAHRTVIDSMRIVLVWGFSLAAQWETHVSLYQVGGFVVLLFGIAVFNGLVWKEGHQDEEHGGVREQVDDVNHNMWERPLIV